MVAEVPPVVVTVMSTAPALAAGEVATNVVVVGGGTDGAGRGGPEGTVEAGVKLAPVMVTEVAAGERA